MNDVYRLWEGCAKQRLLHQLRDNEAQAREWLPRAKEEVREAGKTGLRWIETSWGWRLKSDRYTR